ncbi:MAG: DMT family transporter [Chloroflexota bacterium]
MNALSNNMRGAIFMMLSMIGYVVNDALIKLTSSELGLYQAIFVRGVFITLFIGSLIWWRGISLNPFAYHHRTIWLRVSGEVIGTIFYLTALFNMPLANVSAIIQTAPLAMTLAAALFLGEKVGWRRYIAIFLGFVGVLVIVRPGSEGFTAYSLLVLVTVLTLVLRDLTTQRVPHHIPTLFLAYLTGLMITLMGGVGALFTPWHPLSLNAAATLLLAASFLFFGYIFSITTMRVGEASFTATFRYTVLVWAILLGIFLFGDFPDGLTLLGCAIIATAGIYTLYRERKATLTTR